MKRNITNKYLGAIALALLSALASNAQAQVVIFSGFDQSVGNPASGSPLGWVVGDASNVTMAYVDGAGAGGSQAVVITTDFTGGGFGIAEYEYRNMSVSGNTSANLSDYTLSFDAAVNVANAGFWLVVSAPQYDSVVDYLASPSAILISNPNTFEHFTLNLASDFQDGHIGTFDPLSEWWQVDFNMMSEDFGDPSTGDQLIISNLELTMVPEPSSLALCALSAAAGLVFLRRRTMRHINSLFWHSIARPGANRQDGGAAGSGAVRWGETPGEPLVGQIVRFPACEDARPTNFLAKLYRDRAAASISRLSCLLEA